MLELFMSEKIGY